MQDDTLGISECGKKWKQMNQFLNTRTSMINLQFGQDKCETMHIGKTHISDICCDMSLDNWKEKLIVKTNGEKELCDIYVGTEFMKQVTTKKYLGDIISNDGINKANIIDETSK